MEQTDLMTGHLLHRSENSMQLPCGVLHLFSVVHLSVLLVVCSNTKVLDVASQEHRYVAAVRVLRLKLLGTTTRPLAYVNNCNIRPVVKSVRFEFDHLRRPGQRTSSPSRHVNQIFNDDNLRQVCPGTSCAEVKV